MAKLVDAPDLGSGVLRRVGSSPIRRTMRQKRIIRENFPLFFVVKSTKPTAVGQTKYGQSSYRLGRDKAVLSISTIIGISQAALNNYFSKLVENDEPICKNIECTIRKGTLYVKPTTRGRKKVKDINSKFT